MQYLNADDLQIGATYNVVRIGESFPSDDRSAELTGKLNYGPSRNEVMLAFDGPTGFSIIYNYDAQKFWSYGYSDIQVFADSIGPVLKGGRKRKTRRRTNRHRRLRRLSGKNRIKTLH